MEQTTKTGFAGNSILEIVKHDMGDRVRMELHYNTDKVLNPELKAVALEVFAQNNANYINHYVSEHKHFPTKEDVPELVHETRRKTREDIKKVVETAMHNFIVDCLKDEDFISQTLDRARDILTEEIR